MNKLLSSLTQRRIWRSLVGYPGVTFIWLQAVEFFINNYDFDPRLLTASLIGAVLLFPAAVIWNWRHGEVGTQEVSRTELGAYALFGVAAIAGSLWYWNVTPVTTRPIPQDFEPSRTLAVMPFENADGDAEVQFLCDGIAESLINWLATVDDVKVVSKSAAFRMRDDVNDTAKLADTLGVDGIIRGRLERIGEQIVISTSFVDTRDDSQLCGDRLVRPLNEVIYLERSIVASIKDGLRLEVSAGHTAISASGGTDEPAAYEHYLRGHYLIQSTNTESILEGVDELREAITIDPRFARPHADIADALSQMISHAVEGHDELLDEARSAAYTAVALAPDLAEAQTALATILQYYVFDWEKVDEAYEAAIDLSPQSPVPYHRYTDYLVFTLRPERGREMAARATQLDALDASSMHAVGFAAMFSKDFAAAAKDFGEWNRFHPNSRWSYIKHALALSLDGQCDVALSQATKAENLLNGHPSPLMDSWLAWGYKVCGNSERYEQSVARIRAKLSEDPNLIDPGFAYMYAMEGDVDSLDDLLYRVVETKSSFTFFVQIFLLDYRGWDISGSMIKDPRYLALLDGLNFPPRT